MHMEVTGDAINKRPCYRCTCNKFRGSLAHQPFFRHVTRLSVPCPDYKQRATPRQQLRVIVFHCKSTWPAHTRWANFKSSLETNDPWRRRGECCTLQNDPRCGVLFQGFILSFSIPPVVDLFKGRGEFDCATIWKVFYRPSCTLAFTVCSRQTATWFSHRGQAFAKSKEMQIRSVKASETLGAVRNCCLRQCCVSNCSIINLHALCTISRLGNSRPDMLKPVKHLKILSFRRGNYNFPLYLRGTMLYDVRVV